MIRQESHFHGLGFLRQRALLKLGSFVIREPGRGEEYNRLSGGRAMLTGAGQANHQMVRVWQSQGL
jgi:hypothetical protein